MTSSYTNINLNEAQVWIDGKNILGTSISNVSSPNIYFDFRDNSEVSIVDNSESLLSGALLIVLFW